MAEYIEREALLDLLADTDRCGYLDGGDINSIPAADVAPVVHGEWAKDEEKDMKHCSCCGYRVYFTHNCCPSCGAKMDGERKEPNA